MYHAQQTKPMLLFDSIQPSLLSYNNRPNPVEPNSSLAQPATQQDSAFSSSSNEALSRVLHKNAVQTALQGKTVDGSTAKRRELDDSKTFDLPKLPVRATQERRPRLPPTLSGLYQPPPNAGLLPSISVGPQTAKLVAAALPAEEATLQQKSLPTAAARTTRTKNGRNKWSDAETRQLLQGVSRFGIGSWTRILRCSDYTFANRTAPDLKDRFRICLPEQYGNPDAQARASLSNKRTSERRNRSDRTGTIDLAGLGIRAPLQKCQRRQRHVYTEAEDVQLLEGFRKYGKSWSSIQQDVSFGLNHRTRTDLRDRMRTRFPEQLYAVIAVPGSLPSKIDVPGLAPSQHDANQVPSAKKLLSPSKHVQPNPTHDHQPTSWFDMDPYLSMAFDDAEFDAQTITLDRGILDWPFTNTTESTDMCAARSTDAASTTAINRSLTNVLSLPSLATITAPGNQQLDEDKTMHELPALAQFFSPSLDVDDRSGAHAFLSFDELLGRVP